MDVDKAKDFNELRVKTDKSLDAERFKTDAVIDRKSKTIEDEADKKTLLNRKAADKVQSEDRNAEGAIEPVIEVERLRADEAQDLARLHEDKIRSQEREQKRLVAEALLETERRNTDGKLANERTRADVLSKEYTSLLLEEKTSHDTTKASLITRDQFVAIVSHDLKDPLAAITMGASLMRIALTKSHEEMFELSQLLEIVELGAANMDRMISDLLDVERMSNNKLELEKSNIEICSLLEECIGLFAAVVKSKALKMNVQLCTAPIMVNGDRDKIIQVMSNLIGNALKFSGPKGVIHLSAIEKKNEIEISVADNGPGIQEDKMDQLFERFSQLKINDRRGLGLGLFISKWIIEAHHGRIWVDSKVGKGSTFYFTLPIKSIEKQGGKNGAANSGG